jgi:UDP-N-acetylglucosamine 2-epimerase (non-hydrolysing)
LVIVVGDVNSTLAASIVAAKLGIPLAHVEAGLRSFDRSMPEEINRLVTDTLSDFLFTTCRDANKNLEKEGIACSKIYFVGNVMVDTLMKFMNSAKQIAKAKKITGKYAILTLHRPSNVDDRFKFQNIVRALKKISKHITIIFPAHPRTLKQIRHFRLSKNFIHSNIVKNNAINLYRPLSYLRFLSLMLSAEFILTDSGGIQEEATILGIPCLTLRDNTERPITIYQGTNTLVGSDPKKIIKESLKILSGNKKEYRAPKFWDGRSAKRIVDILLKKI